MVPRIEVPCEPRATINLLIRGRIYPYPVSEVAMAERHEQEAWVRLGMEFLKPNDREILILREWDGLSYEEIAQRLEITVNAATVRHLRAVRNLAKQVDKLRQGGGDPGPDP